MTVYTAYRYNYSYARRFFKGRVTVKNDLLFYFLMAHVGAK
jgi:hypothetical protein